MFKFLFSRYKDIKDAKSRADAALKQVKENNKKLFSLLEKEVDDLIEEKRKEEVEIISTLIEKAVENGDEEEIMRLSALLVSI
tara:strand:- start:357 stop:605 length:249 start_codon:yes stop_codon:yes gene_type:complete